MMDVRNTYRCKTHKLYHTSCHIQTKPANQLQFNELSYSYREQYMEVSCMRTILGKAKWLSKLCRSFAWAQVQRRADLREHLKGH